MKLGYPNDNEAEEPVFAIVRLSEGGYETCGYEVLH